MRQLLEEIRVLTKKIGNRNTLFLQIQQRMLLLYKQCSKPLPTKGASVSLVPPERKFSRNPSCLTHPTVQPIPAQATQSQRAPSQTISSRGAPVSSEKDKVAQAQKGDALKCSPDSQQTGAGNSINGGTSHSEELKRNHIFGLGDQSHNQEAT